MVLNHRRTFCIELPGLHEDLRSAAENDIEKLVDFISPIAERLDLPFLLRLVRVTDHLQVDVNRLEKENSGFGGYVARRNELHGIGRTCVKRSENGELGFAVIVDARLMKQWRIDNPWCFITILHELGHVLLETLHLHTLGSEEYFADADTGERVLAKRARSLSDEFSVDRLVDLIVFAIAKDESGQPLSLREIDEARGLNWPQEFSNRLKQMPKFIDDKVYEYKAVHGNLERFLSEVPPYVTDTLTLLSYVAARYMETDLWPEMLNGFKKSEACRRFMKEHLDNLLDHLGKSKITSSKSLQGVASAVEGIFHNCGVGYKTVPNGVYVSVGWPSVKM